MREVSVREFLTDDEIRQALILYATMKAQNHSGFAKRFSEQVIAPNIKRINAALGQENDPLYLAYAIESALEEAINFVKNA